VLGASILRGPNDASDGRHIEVASTSSSTLAHSCAGQGCDQLLNVVEQERQRGEDAPAE
jgi:hypothetical protein